MDHPKMLPSRIGFGVEKVLALVPVVAPQPVESRDGKSGSEAAEFVGLVLMTPLPIRLPVEGVEFNSREAGFGR